MLAADLAEAEYFSFLAGKSGETIKAHKFLCGLPWCPFSTERPCEKASNSERRRWLVNKAVVINGKKPGPDDLIEFPVTELVFFPKSDDRRTTMA